MADQASISTVKRYRTSSVYIYMYLFHGHHTAHFSLRNGQETG